MNWYKNLRVKSKLLIGFTIVTAFAVALAVLAVLTVNDLDASYTYLLNFPEKRLEYLMRVDTYCSDMRRATTAISLNSGNATVIDNYWAQFEAAYEGAIGNIENYLASNNADTVRDSETLQANNAIVLDIKSNLESYRMQANLGMEAARIPDNFEMTNAIFLGGASSIANVDGTLDELIVKAGGYMANVSDANTQEKKATVNLFYGLLGAAAFLSIVTALYIAGQISKPLIVLTGFMNKAGATGDITIRPEDTENIAKHSKSKDEIGQCIGSTASFVMHMIDVGTHLEMVANGDLTAELALLSNHDTLGLSLQKMTGNLNAMFREINASTRQVANGSKQIADGAQSLAQGATEQASAIEELSASISKIADQTRQNAGVAREAANLSGAIRDGAEKGSAQMGQMMQAVKEINEASNQISKVIKVIDDIAFQTNILALNAAVEAARAGQHGKGFAVVAEEVRNLAGKSAEAARDTGELIENSIGKANLGLSIATETSGSLQEIVDGINRSAEIVLQIAQSSDEQAGAISQINTGIDQVAQVVQQNSATAEQSAAASEEMSGQSNILEQLISQFKLKNFEPAYSIGSPAHSKELVVRQDDDLAFLGYNGEYGKY